MGRHGKRRRSPGRWSGGGGPGLRRELGQQRLDDLRVEPGARAAAQLSRARSRVSAGRYGRSLVIAYSASQASVMVQRLATSADPPEKAALQADLDRLVSALLRPPG